jgi:hypothetical protein
MFCPKCGAQNSGAFCTECGSSTGKSGPQDGELFKKRDGKAANGFWKSGVVAAAGFAAIASVVLSSYFWVSLDESQTEERQRAAEVNRQTQVVAQAEKEYLESSKKYLGRLLCLSSSWVCNIVHGYSFTLKAASDEDESEMENARRSLAAAEGNLSNSRKTSAELEMNLTYSAAGGGAATLLLFGIRVLTYRRQTRG